MDACLLLLCSFSFFSTKLRDWLERTSPTVWQLTSQPQCTTTAPWLVLISHTMVAYPRMVTRLSTNLAEHREGAYNFGKHGNLKELVNFGKLWEFEICSGNFYKSDAFIFMTQSETNNKPICKCVATVVPMWTAGSGLAGFGGHYNFRQWNYGITPTLTFITQYRLSLRLGLGRPTEWLAWVDPVTLTQGDSLH